MADHFYSIATVGEAFVYDPSQITVGTSSTAGNPIEIRVTDGTMTAQAVYRYLEKMAAYFATKNAQIIVAGTLL